ncbi:MAG: MarR family winged helix-turn-helix transcriptional regulator [Candidatus Onthomonas sp.]
MSYCVPEPANYISLMFQLNRAKHNATQAALAAEGLQDVGQPRILFLLKEEDEDGGLPAQQELAQRLHVSPATVAHSLNSLERMGYINRQPDPGDRRKKRIAITEKGRNARSRCIAVFDRVDAQLYSGFSPGELEQLQQYYQRMLDNMKAIGGSTEPCPLPPMAGKE